MNGWNELPFEVHSHPAPARVWERDGWYLDTAPQWAGHPYAYALARSLDPFAWCELFPTAEDAAEYATYLSAEVNHA
jgi:hypothetical protein